MPTYGTSLALAALAVALSALFLAGRAARPSVVARRSNRRAVEVPVAAIVVLVAAASTAAALYSTQTSRATAEPATKPPVYWRITDIPHGADARREAPFRPATLPPVKTGKVVRLSITAENKTIEIAPGVTVNAWTFNNSVPAPVIHLRVGQKVILTFHNHGTTWHSFDSHGTEIPYQHANQDIGVGASKTFTWVARRPGAYLYHCFTFPGAAHIASGMYGAMIVDDPKHPLPKASREFVLVAGEWYLDGDGQTVPANTDPRKAQSGFPDYATFNAYWQEYSYRPLAVPVNKLVRFYVVNAGPNFDVAFHVVGGIFTRFYPNSDERHPQTDIQTGDVPAGGAAIYDVKFDRPGVYNFVNHMFANAVKGQLGEIVVGNAHG